MVPKRGAGISTRIAALTDRSRDAQMLLLHKRLLGERLYLYSLARFLVVAAIIAGALFAKNVVGVEDLDVPKLVGVAAALAIYNSIVFLMVRPLRGSDKAAASYSILSVIMHGTIMLDFLILTIALWLVGGAQSPFQAFYLFNVILASILMSRTAAILHTLFGYLLLAGLVVGEWAEWIPSCFPAGAVVSAGPLDGRFVLTLLTVYGLLFSLSVLLLTGLAQLLRLGERDLRHANEELQRLSAMRRDFLQLLLHDLKSPLSAVAQHLYNVEAHLHDNLSNQIPEWLGRCQLRVREVSEFLHDLQVLAILESDEIQKRAKSLDLKSFLGDILAEYQDSAKMRNHSMTLEVPEEIEHVQGIERLLREAVANLITNAIKYTPPGGQILVRARVDPDAVCIEVKDDGIGIAKEDQERLFQEMSVVRLKPHASADITGRSGLGLSLVRRIAELHNGTVAVVSAPDCGSTFTIRLPHSPQLR